jgi:hypothetical protein
MPALVFFAGTEVGQALIALHSYEPELSRVVGGHYPGRSPWDGEDLLCSLQDGLPDGVDGLEQVDLRSWGSALSDSMLCALVVTCPKLTSVNLTQCHDVTGAGVAALAAGLPQLLSVDLSYCSRITDVGITALGESCPELESVNLRCCTNVTDAGIAALAASKCQRALQSLFLDFCAVTDVGLAALGAGGCPTLQKIDLRSCPKITNTGVAALAKGCPQLSSVDVRFCNSVTSAVRQSFVAEGFAFVKL